MSTDTPNSQESTGTETDPTIGTDPDPSTDSDPNARTVTGPHDGRDSDGELDHRFWRCQRCGLETTDPRLREGCFRCGGESDTTDGGPPDG